MKKIPVRKPKLQLQRDTVRELSDRQLAAVAAAADSNQTASGGLDCATGKF